ncbi:hypothetical protein MASR2M74_07330 [Paracoccaceae bacterium]
MPKTIRSPASPAGCPAMAEPGPVKAGKLLRGKAPSGPAKGKVQGKHAAPVTRRLEVPGKGRAR